MLIHRTVFMAHISMVPFERMTSSAILTSIEPFAHASAFEIDVLSSSATRSRKRAGKTILQSGHDSDGLYVVLRGRVNLIRENGSNRDLILASLGPGEVFGESCVLEDRNLSSTASAAIATELLRIPASALQAHIQRDPQTLLQLLKLMGEKLKNMESIASGLALFDVEERLRQTLARLARRQGRPDDSQDGWILAPVPTQTELARMVGSCRETVSRTLSSMAKSGKLSASGRRMVLSESVMSAAAGI